MARYPVARVRDAVLSVTDCPSLIRLAALASALPLGIDLHTYFASVTSMKTTLVRALSCAFLLILALPRLAAQAATGSITGTVANSSTRQFLTSAEVKIAGTAT